MGWGGFGWETMSSKELTVGQSSQYVGPYRLEKTLGKGQTGRSLLKLHRDVQDVDVGGCT